MTALARPHTTAILAMSADGKIADRARSAARFASPRDKQHLEGQIARTDGVLFGAGTLRAYRTSLPIASPALLQHRQYQGKPPQPVQIVCSASGTLDPAWRFFQQDFPRWLLTSPTGAQSWQHRPEFDRVLPLLHRPWPEIFQQFAQLKLERLALLGGGTLLAALFDARLVDELWLTVCPLILGGTDAPTPVDGEGFLATAAQRLELCEVLREESELFLHYRVLL